VSEEMRRERELAKDSRRYLLRERERETGTYKTVFMYF
jgi:hypothetical protein